MSIGLYVSLAIFAAFAIYLFLDLSRVSIWALDAQRGFQNQMAAGVHALKTGEASAYVTLLSATAAYGFVHALGPGYGKYLVGGVGLGTSISSVRLMGLAVASSVAQAHVQVHLGDYIRVITPDTTGSTYGSLTYLVGGYQAELAEPI